MKCRAIRGPDLDQSEAKSPSLHWEPLCQSKGKISEEGANNNLPEHHLKPERRHV